ncbi:MAG TPA: glycosyltransferase family 4 protein [Fibrobacteria bacterium]|nr:glycosyltransferase family 4 protein [Fibrobacteria bacterium]
MKLLIIGPYPFRNNGMSDFIAQYKGELERRGHEVVTEPMYFWRDKRTAFRWLSLRARLHEGFDAVIVQHTPTASGPFLPSFLRAARRLRVPVIVVAHEMPSVYAKHLPRLARPLYHAYERAIMRLAAARVVQADLYVAEMRGIGVKDDLVVIPVPAYAARFPVPPLDGERPFWGYYGMISPKKGVDLLLEAYQGRAPGLYPPLRLLGGPAPGNEAYVESLKAGVSPAHRPFVDFRGYVEDAALPGELARMALVILPYRWASQSAVLTEALRHHAPYLASDLPFFADFQRRYGCGSVFKSGSAEALARALDEAAGHPSAARSQAFEAVLEDLSLARCADKLLDVIARVWAEAKTARA